MSVKADLSGKNAVVTITTDISDITAAVGIGAEEKRIQSLRRVLAELSDAVAVANKPDKDIDDEAAKVAAEVVAQAARRKAVKPTGSL